MEIKNNKLIVVLGMHRSGTSAITRGLQVMGVGLGDRIMPPFEDNNPKGFWEDIDLNTLNIEMLRAIDSDWYHLAPIKPVDVEILRKQDFLLRAVDLLRQKVGSSPVFGFKDPRVAKLLPFWKEVFSHCQFDVSYLLAVRHPLSVVKSLAKRDGIEAEQIYLLWLGHVITSLTGSAGDKRVLIDYDRLMQSPDPELMRVAECIGLEIDPAELQSYKNEFLDQDLRHTVYELNDLLLDDTCPPIVREVYAALLDVASEKIKFDDLELQNKIVRWSDEFERLRSPLLLVDKILMQKMVANQAVAERDGQIVNLNHAEAERDGQISSLNQAVAERDGQIDSLNQAVVERDGKIDSLNQAVVERDGQIVSLNQAVAEHDGQRDSLNQTMAERDGQRGSLKQAVAERDGQILSLNQAVAERKQEVAALRSSYSWCITKPLRVLSRPLDRKHFVSPRGLKQPALLLKRAYKRLTQDLDKLPNGNDALVAAQTAFLHFHIEGSSLQVGPTSPALQVTGWCFSTDSKEPVELQVRCGTKILSQFVCDALRTDVEAAFPPELINCSAIPQCGFDHSVIVSTKNKTVELFSPQHDHILKRFSSKDMIATESCWLVGQEGTANKKRLQVLWEIVRKAKGIVRRDTIFSIDNWKLWLLYAKEDLHQSRHTTITPPPEGLHLSPADAFTEKNQIKPHVRKILQKAVDDFSYQPTISLIMPVYNVEPQFLEEAIASVKNQIYPLWELCIADDASTREETKEVLKSQNDPRIKITYRSENGHICKASNDAALQASGDFVALMDNDDLLAPHALFEIVRLLQKNPAADLIYSDEDKIDLQGKHFDLHFKPDWSPTLLLGYNYINHLTCIRRSLFEDVGSFRPGYEGAQDYDLLLRVTEKTDKIFHIPKILYHWRAIPGSTAFKAEEKPIVGTSAYRILGEALERRGIAAQIYQPEFARKINVPVQQLDFADDGPSVEIIIPTYNKGDILKTCIDSIRQKTTYRNYKIMVVDNDSNEEATLTYLKKLKAEGLRVEHIANGPEGFSFSRINNIAVDRSDTDLVLFLNNDTEVIEPKWLSRMVGYLQLPGVGATGARLIYPDNRIQHAGVILGMVGGFIPDHAFCRMSRDLPGYFFLPGTSRECSAVTGACLLTRRESFLQAGGFDEQDFNISLNDVDLCLKVRGEGLRIIYVAGAELYHHESLSRIANDDPAELANFREKHGAGYDPYYSPNLSRSENYTILPECTLDYADLLGTKLKVVFFSHNLNYEGAPNILFEVARGLKEKGRVDPIIVAPCDGPQREALVQEGFEVHIVPVRKHDNILLGWTSRTEIEDATARMQDFLNIIKPDVVVANVVNSYFVVNAAHNISVPSVWWIHESYDYTLMLREIKSLGMAVCEDTFTKATVTLFVSHATSRLYRRYNKKQNFQIIHNSLDTEKINQLVTAESKQSARKSLNVADGLKVLICVGTVCDRKDQGTLVEAINLLAKTRNDFICFIVGFRETLPYGKMVAKRISELGINELVKLVPETKEVEKYYLSADLFVFTSLNESYSLTILEAMAFGLPLVTTECQGVSEQVRFGTNALRFDFRNSKMLAKNISLFLDDDDKRKQWGRNSQQMMRYKQSNAEMLEKHEHVLFSSFQEGIVE